MFFLKHSVVVFTLVGCICYLEALLVSYVFVRWILPKQMVSRLGNQARFVTIDGIRGFLAFGVYVHHTMVTWLFLQGRSWGGPLHNIENQFGKTSVAIFFMITAFLFWGRAQARRNLNWREFFVSRLFRIYPLYLFAVSVICVAVAYKCNWVALEPAFGITKEIFKWLIFRAPVINDYSATSLVVAGVTWTLLYEAWFYLSLPLLVTVFLRRQAAWIKVICLSLVVGLFFLNHLSPAIAATFSGGILAVYWRTHPTRIKLVEGKLASFVALACLLCAGILLYEPFNLPGIVLLSVFFVVISSGNTLFGILKTRPALWLGEISYSIYLCHGMVLWLVLQNFFARLPSFHLTVAWYALSAIAIAPLVILFCSLTYLMIERPFLDFGHRLFGRRSVLSIDPPATTALAQSVRSTGPAAW